MSIAKVSRREFVKLTSAASAGLVLGVTFRVEAASKSKPKAATAPHDLGTFVQVDDDGMVTVWVPKSDMGQGVRTSLPMIVAEELDADWTKVRIRQAHFDKKFGRQGTGGSSSVRTMWQPMRQAGATARAMLVSAAAAKLGVPADSLTVSDGVIAHAASGRKLAFGDVAADAAKIDVPKDVKLKDAKSFTRVGKHTDRIDNRDIVTGNATYGIDVRVPGMLHAVVKRSPAFGGKVVSFDDRKALAVPGVKKIVKIDAIGTDLPWSGVAVVADSTWAAMKGRDALDVKWDAPPAESSESLRKQLRAAVVRPAKRITDIGNAETATISAAQRVEATYELPYLAHATMEPMNATASVTANGVEIWAPTQFPDWANGTVAQALKLKPEQVKVNVTMLGGGFGRKANPDFALEAALVSQAAGVPVHVQWTREDDMQHDYYRPASQHRATAGLDPDGRLIAWTHRFAAPSIDTYFHPETDKPHDSEMGGLEDLPYSVPNLRIEFVPVPSVVPRGWWRSVDYSINGFVVNSFLDEAAHAAGKDPIEFHLSMLTPGRRIDSTGPNAKNYPFEIDRLRRVIEVVRDASGWGKKELGEGRGRGFAAQRSFLSYVAQVAEVTVAKNGTISVDRIVAAIDCGTPVNPDGIAAQIEGSIVYGLTAALHGEITTSGGTVQQSNFHDYPLLRISEMPLVEVHIVPSTALPTGTGEPGLPPVAPAVANAIWAATGKRLRTLPFKMSS
ncbi:MAG TPA: xanthine dehydrogenase family protein molybdopterin-binding subunit [Thermoanaerobaculia bacterium]